MKQIHKDILLAVILGLVLPWFLLNGMVQIQTGGVVTDLSTAEQENEQAQLIEKVPMTMYLRRDSGEIVTMDMDTYLVGVLLAEMPASFEDEAKKAQSVVARTFAWKAVVTGGKHGDGSVCCQSACCQAYISPEEYRSKGGGDEAIDSANAAVLATSGYLLTYDGELIEATYFSCSGGSTEDAVAVWGTDYPYLRATDSPGEEYATHYTDTVRFTAEEFAENLGTELSGDPGKWFGLTTYTAGGGIATMEIGGIAYTGTQLRSLLGLRSTAFTIAVEENAIVITTRGYGHRVGMSQYGADAMAASGSGFEEILQHYYRGAELVRWEGEN